MKRLILCSDGTLDDADRQVNECRISNIARLSRAMIEVDRREGVEIEQVKLYQSGVGTDETSVGSLITGALGRGMMGKVRDLYDFLALNFEQGDEIFLFGFSRGAYIVRLLACLVDIIGILPPRRYLYLFPRIFEALDAHTGRADDDDRRAIESIRALLDPLASVRQAQRAQHGGFLIECVGVFDTVGTRGRPSYLRSRSFSTSPVRLTVAQAELNSFGLPSAHVPSCVRVALQALALDEHRKDFSPVLWKRWQAEDAIGERLARQREQQGQRVEQVWFAGAHADVGGGYPEADLSFLTLEWMISRVSDKIAVDDGYLKRIYSHTTAPWGQLQPHQSRVDEYRLAPALDRILPSLPVDPCTMQYLHASVAAQPHAHLRSEILPLLDGSQEALIAPLGEREKWLRRAWATPIGKGSPTLTATRSTPVGDPVTVQNHREADVGEGISHSDVRSRAIARPSSVTSFTDNESTPPSSPTSSTSSNLPLQSQPSQDDDALFALRGRQALRRSSPIRRSFERLRQTVFDQARKSA